MSTGFGGWRGGPEPTVVNFIVSSSLRRASSVPVDRGQALALVAARARHVLISIEAERLCDRYHHAHAPVKRHAFALRTRQALDFI